AESSVATLLPLHDTPDFVLHKAVNALAFSEYEAQIDQLPQVRREVLQVAMFQPLFIVALQGLEDVPPTDNPHQPPILHDRQVPIAVADEDRRQGKGVV